MIVLGVGPTGLVRLMADGRSARPPRAQASGIQPAAGTPPSAARARD
jgi:hypothetical protein